MKYIPNQFPFLHAKLRAERPRFIVLVMTAILIVSSVSTRANEPVEATPASTNTTSSVTNSNSINPVQGISISHSNSALASLSQTAGTASVSGTTNPPSTDLSPTGSVVVVIQKRFEGGLFSAQRGNGSFGFANIEAGFGQAYDNDSIVLRGRNGTAWEETRYVFVKKVIKF